MVEGTKLQWPILSFTPPPIGPSPLPSIARRCEVVCRDRVAGKITNRPVVRKQEPPLHARNNGKWALELSACWDPYTSESSGMSGPSDPSRDSPSLTISRVSNAACRVFERESKRSVTTPSRQLHVAVISLPAFSRQRDTWWSDGSRSRYLDL